MKQTISFASLLFIALIIIIYVNNQKQIDLFEQWKQNYGNSIEFHQQPFRKLIFQKNLIKIKAHNSDPTQTYKMGVNQFSIYTDKQFKIKFLAQITLPTNIESTIDSEQYLTTAIDWTIQGKVSRVKNQGSCGSCWAFSATGVAESYALFFNQVWDLSQQELVDCSGPYGNGGCNGGYPSKALFYVRDRGLTTQSSYPYVGKTNTCTKNGGQFRINGVWQISGCNGLANGITSRPLSVTVDASNWAQYHSGVFGNCAASINHCVLLVGTDSNGVWKIKNSWGTGWGEGGFIRLLPGNTCGICAYGGVYIS